MHVDEISNIIGTGSIRNFDEVNVDEVKRPMRLLVAAVIVDADAEADFALMRSSAMVMLLWNEYNMEVK